MILRRWLRREEKEANLERELRFHIEERVAGMVRSGVSEEDARRRVRLEFGAAEQIKEECRDVQPARWVETFVQDIRYALRNLRRNPGFAAVAIATLALGIGGLTAMFSAFDSILIRPLPYADPDRLVMVWDDLSKTDDRTKSAPAPAEWYEWRRLNTVFTDIASTQPTDATLSGDAQPEQVPARKTTGNLWSVLGVKPLIGRVFNDEEDRNGVRVAVISYGLWQRRYGGSPDVLGRKIDVNDTPYEVIGVMPREFYFLPARDIDLWMPASFPASMRKAFGWHDEEVVARLKAGVTREQAERSMAAESATHCEGLPETAPDHRDIVAPRHHGQDTNRPGCLAGRVGGAAVDRLRQSRESADVSRIGARAGGGSPYGAWGGRWKIGRAIPHRKPRARRTRGPCGARACRAHDASSRQACAGNHGPGAAQPGLARARVLRRGGDCRRIGLRTCARLARVTDRPAGRAARRRTRRRGRAQLLVPAFPNSARDGPCGGAADQRRPAAGDLSAPAEYGPRRAAGKAADL